MEATAVPVVSPADMSRVRAAAAQEKRPIKVAEAESCVSRVSWRLQPSVHPCTKAKEGRRTEAGRCDLAPTLYQCIHSSGCWPHICLVPLKRGFFFFSVSGRIKAGFFSKKFSSAQVLFLNHLTLRVLRQQSQNESTSAVLFFLIFSPFQDNRNNFGVLKVNWF